jgi:Putative transposase DNA-binding domain
MAALRLDSGVIRSYTVPMKLTIQLQVLPDADQAAELLDTMKHFNAAASFAAGVGLEAKVSSQPSIHKRCYVRREQRARLTGWAFDQLRRFIEYKARLAGVPVLYVDPADTSRTYAECGHCEKANRRSRDRFECRHCGHSDRADANAARNIRTKGRRQAA